jgi:hypothetical protein
LTRREQPQRKGAHRLPGRGVAIGLRPIPPGGRIFDGEPVFPDVRNK